MEIYLVIPPVSDCFMPTLGVAQIAGYLKKNGINCKVCDASAELLHIIFDSQKGKLESILGMSEDGDYTYKNVISSLKEFSSVHGELQVSTDDFQSGFHWRDMDRLLEYVEQEKDFSAELEKLSMLQEMADHDLQYFGFSVSYESQVIPTLLLAKIIKKRNPKVKICIGGSLLYNYEKDFYNFLYLFDTIDFLIIGAGEEAWLRIGLDQWDELAQLQGIHVKKVQNKYVIDTRDMMEKPVVYKPDFSDINFTFYPVMEKAFPYMIHDRCYYGKCYFCNGDRMESQSVGKDIKRAFAIMQEIADELGICNIYIVDAALSPRDMKVISEIPLQAPVKWIANGRFDKGLRDEDLIAQIAQKGCVMLRFGLESASQGVLDLMNKGTQVSDAQEILHLTAKYGIRNHVYIMFGYPGETMEDRDRTIRFMECNKSVISSYSVSVFQPIPGTIAYEQLEKRLGDGENTYERMISLIYKDEQCYNEINEDISRLSRVLRGYVETNSEFYSANIFNGVSSNKDINERLSIQFSPERKLW